jgi:hypothetical protein
MSATMTPYETYTKYLALKQHFTSESYDYFRYGGKVRVKMETFEKRHDKYFFYKLSKKKNVEEFLVANFIDNNSSWVGSLSQDKASEEIYATWKKRQESLGYLYKSDIEKIDPPLDSVLKVEDGNYPKLLMMYKQGDIMLETLVILNQLVKFIPHWNKNINDTVLWPILRDKIIKYSPFVKFDNFKFKKLTLDHFS